MTRQRPICEAVAIWLLDNCHDPTDGDSSDRPESGRDRNRRSDGRGILGLHGKPGPLMCLPLAQALDGTLKCVSSPRKSDFVLVVPEAWG